MRTIVALLIAAGILAVAGCQQTSSESNTPAPNSMQPSGADTNAPVTGTNTP